MHHNLSAHTTPGALRKADRLWIYFVPISTTASRCSPIEADCRPIRAITPTRTGHRDWREIGGAIQGAMREVNRKRSGRPTKVRLCLWSRQ